MMKYVYKVSSIALMLMVLVVITACGPSSIEVRDYALTADISGLELDESQSPTTHASQRRFSETAHCSENARTSFSCRRAVRVST